MMEIMNIVLIALVICIAIGIPYIIVLKKKEKKRLNNSNKRKEITIGNNKYYINF